MSCLFTITLLPSCDGLVCADPSPGTIVLPGSGGVSVPCTICNYEGSEGGEVSSICVPGGLGVWEPGDPIVVSTRTPDGHWFYFYGNFDASGNFCVTNTQRTNPAGG